MNTIPSTVHTAVGSYLIITIHGLISRYLAEVIQESPTLIVKITEIDGVLNYVEEHRIQHVHIAFTERFQHSRQSAAALLRSFTTPDDWPMCGLKSLGLTGVIDVDSIDAITYPEHHPA